MAHTTEEIQAIMNQPEEGYFSDGADAPEDDTPYYMYGHDGAPIEWPGLEWRAKAGVIDREMWWLRVKNKYAGILRNHTYWCFPRVSTDPPVDAMYFRYVETRAQLLDLEDAIAYMKEPGEPGGMRERPLWGVGMDPPHSGASESPGGDLQRVEGAAVEYAHGGGCGVLHGRGVFRGMVASRGGGRSGRECGGVGT